MDKRGVIDKDWTPAEPAVKQAAEQAPEVLADHPVSRLTEAVVQQQTPTKVTPPSAS